MHRGHRVEEARRQAPEPAVAQPRVGLLFEQGEQVEVLVLDGLLGDGIEQEVRYVVGQRAAEEELHRQVVDALGVLALVGLLGQHPALREDVAHGARERLEALARAGGSRADDVVEQQVAFIECLVRSGKLDGAAAVLSAELRQAVGPRRCRGGCLGFVAIASSL